MTTLKARAKLEAGEREFRIKELKRLLANHERDPNYRHACTGWRELLDLRDWEAGSSETPDTPWKEAVAHGLAFLKRERERGNGIKELVTERDRINQRIGEYMRAPLKSMRECASDTMRSFVRPVLSFAANEPGSNHPDPDRYQDGDHATHRMAAGVRVNLYRSTVRHRRRSSDPRSPTRSLGMRSTWAGYSFLRPTVESCATRLAGLRDEMANCQRNCGRHAQAGHPLCAQCRDRELTRQLDFGRRKQKRKKAWKHFARPAWAKRSN
jgi:hypothetical protein